MNKTIATMPDVPERTAESYAATITFPVVWCIVLVGFMALSASGFNTGGAEVTRRLQHSNGMDIAYVPVTAILGWLVHLISGGVVAAILPRLTVPATLRSSALAGLVSILAIELTIFASGRIYSPSGAPGAVSLVLYVAECFGATYLARVLVARRAR